MENKKLSWKEIEKQYDQQWVQLIDYVWEEGEPYPASGVLQFHASNRRDFDRLSRENPVEDAACVFVGKPKIPPGVILSANAMKIRVCE